MVSLPSYSLFRTALGECAVAWSALGISGVWLPDVSPLGLRSKLQRRLGATAEAAPPSDIAAAIAAMARLLAGERIDLLDVRLDETRLDAFERQVYGAARRIAPGRVVTYGELAERVGGGASARAIGQTLGRNPFPIVVPCHRIVAAGGELGGFSAPGGADTKRHLLTIENARLDGSVDLFDLIDAPPAASATAPPAPSTR